MARVLVLGGGFGGIATAVALREGISEADEIILVDRRDDFAMGIRKTWHILGISPLAYGTRHLGALSRRGITFRRGEITAIDPAARSVIVDDEVVEADALVVALGAAHEMGAIPGLAEHGVDVWSLESMEHAHAAVDGLRGGRVVVGIFGTPYSCPPAPYELALLLAERFGERAIDAPITVFGPAPITLPVVGVAGCATLDGRLAEEGIAYLGGRVATSVGDGSVTFHDGESLAFDLLLTVPPHRVSPILVAAGMAEAGRWVGVDSRTLETGWPGVYAIGDCTVVGLSNGTSMPKAGVFAQKEGEAVAARIAAQLRGEEPTATFDGAGACFLEMGAGEASTIRGDFFADPPAATLSAPSRDQREEKERFESDRLAAWFGA